jgi:glutamate formiminotransferase/formiminotetrahydrofolate cyclodeaminase
MRLVECVPNFSEGRDSGTLDAIAASIRAVNGVQLLDVDPGADTNRTVFTFVGTPEAIEEAAFQAIAAAARLIDMRAHKGEHPRMGATDVCPFIPIEGVEVAECVRLAERLGERVARELAIPIYLYESAARKPERRNLANIRAGEYEGLAQKMADPNWLPDFPAPYNARAGATVIGVREFLIAYNVNLNTTDKKLAHDIALTIREAGRAKRDDDGNIVKDASGKSVNVPGLLPQVKAVGWYIEAYRQAQVSINLTNYKVTPPHVVYDVIRAEADKRGLIVTGSELVGLIPLEAMRMAGRHYLQKQGRSPGVPDEELVSTAIRSLGLDQLSAFDPMQKIIEYRFRQPAGPLSSMSVHAFSGLLSTDAPAPGGGSASAVAGALASALAAMVGNLTANGLSVYQKRRDEGRVLHDQMCALAETAQQLQTFYLQAVDRDTDAFNALMGAMRQKATSDTEKEARAQAVLAATKGAIDVPLGILERSVEVLELARTAGVRGNPNCASDAGVAASMALAAAQGGYYNVLINLKSVTDAAYVATTRERAAAALARARELAREVEVLMDEKLGAEPTPQPASVGTRPPGSA